MRYAKTGGDRSEMGVEYQGPFVEGSDYVRIWY